MFSLPDFVEERLFLEMFLGFREIVLEIQKVDLVRRVGLHLRPLVEMAAYLLPGWGMAVVGLLLAVPCWGADSEPIQHIELNFSTDHISLA